MPVLMCDLDDTLVPRRELFAEWASDLARRHGRDEDFVAWLVEADQDGWRPRDELFADLRERLGLDDSVDSLVATYLVQFADTFRPGPGVVDALVDVREQGWRVAVVTNGSLSQLRKIAAAGLEPLVDAVCVSEVEGIRKPDPDIFARAAQRCRESLEGAWMIGDSATADMAGARAAGIGCVWLHLGRSWPDLGFEPDHVADSFPDAARTALRTPVRPTARVLLVDGRDRVLLFRGHDPVAPEVRFWFPPGGGIEAGESAEDAARREVREETGLAEVVLGPHIWNRRHVVRFYGVLADLRELWFLARTPSFDVDTSGFTDLERETVPEHRWWTLRELEAAEDVLAPRDLAGLVRRLLEDGPPPSPVTIGV
jgi:putative hydrolase of the HAD superfamily